MGTLHGVGHKAQDGYMMANITTEIQLLPFRVPNYVIQKVPVRPRQDGYHEAPKYHLSELSEETLMAMCAEFQVAVLAKARTRE